MTVVIRNLEKEGLITRHVNEDDRRAFVIGLTEAGRTLIGPVFEQHLFLLEDVFGRLTQEDKDALLVLLKKMNGIVD